MFRLVIYRRQRARFPRPVAPSAGASHTHTASYNYSHSHRLEHLRFLRGSPRDLSSLRTQHGNTAGYVRGKQVARMTSLFLRAVANLRSAAQSAAAQAAQPAPVPAAPVVWDKRNEEELKRIIPLSIIELKDGSFAATPAKRCVQRDGPTGLKLFASTEGRLDGGSSAVDIANVKRIAMGVLTDPAVGGLSGTEAGSLRWFGVECTVQPVVASTFSELEVAAPPKHGSKSRARILNVLTQLNVTWRPWGAAADPTFRALAGLPTPREVATAALDEDTVVGPVSAFTASRAAILTALDILVVAPGAAGAPGTSSPSVGVADYARFLAGVIGDATAVEPLSAVLATTVVACSSTDPTALATHTAAKAAARTILVAARGVLDAIGAAEAGWVRDRRDDMRRAGFAVSMDQLGALVARAPTEAVVALAPAPAPAPTAATPPPSSGLSAADVARIVAEALTQRFGTFPTAAALPSSPPPPFALGGPSFSPSPSAPTAPPPPVPPASPFPTIDSLSFEAVTDSSSAAEALTELGNGDGGKLCDLLAKLESDAIDLAGFMGHSLDERALEAERRLLRMVNLSHFDPLPGRRPAS